MGEPFSITCIIPVSEQVEWTKDGEVLKMGQPTDVEQPSNGNNANMRHMKSDYLFTESDTDDLDEGIVTKN